jgi:hypothetical protein
MEVISERMFDRERIPSEKEVSKLIGATNFKRWKKILKFINDNYEGVFKQDEWLYGGKKHGWYLRFKKSKSFCQFIPEKNKFLLLIVFGAKERKKTELILKELNPIIRKKYKEAKTFFDGKWMLLDVDKDELIEDIKKLLIIKRKPKSGK